MVDGEGQFVSAAQQINELMRGRTYQGYCYLSLRDIFSGSDPDEVCNKFIDLLMGQVNIPLRKKSAQFGIVYDSDGDFSPNADDILDFLTSALDAEASVGENDLRNKISLLVRDLLKDGPDREIFDDPEDELGSKTYLSSLMLFCSQFPNPELFFAPLVKIYFRMILFLGSDVSDIGVPGLYDTILMAQLYRCLIENQQDDRLFMEWYSAFGDDPEFRAKLFGLSPAKAFLAISKIPGISGGRYVDAYKMYFDSVIGAGSSAVDFAVARGISMMRDNPDIASDVGCFLNEQVQAGDLDPKYLKALPVVTVSVQQRCLRIVPPLSET